MNFTDEQRIKQLFPNASGSFIKRNQARAGLQDPKPEQAVRHEPLGAKEGKGQVPPRTAVRITSFRTRILDIDNCTGGCKCVLDGLRYAGILHDDRPEDITLEVRQEKVKSREQERTEVLITKEL